LLVGISGSVMASAITSSPTAARGFRCRCAAARCWPGGCR
jgi:hypothetical protein